MNGFDFQPSYVVKDWYASFDPDRDGHYVAITSRPTGLFSKILELMGIDPTNRLLVDDEKFIFEQSSLTGHTRTVVPTDKVSSVAAGYSKPLVSAIILCILGLFLFVIGAVIGLVYYYYARTASIEITASGSVNEQLKLKAQSLFATYEIEEEQLETVSQILRERVLSEEESSTRNSRPANLPE